MVLLVLWSPLSPAAVAIYNTAVCILIPPAMYAEATWNKWKLTYKRKFQGFHTADWLLSGMSLVTRVPLL